MLRTYLSLASLRGLFRDLRHAWQVIRDGHEWRVNPPVPPDLKRQARAEHDRKAS
jgi:hypothetical protein